MIISRIANIFVAVFIFFTKHSQLRYVYLNITCVVLNNNILVNKKGISRRGLHFVECLNPTRITKKYNIVQISFNA
jgi:hypothetical protein